MKQSLYALIISCILSCGVYGQATGYMGKRFGIYYQPVLGLGSNREDRSVTTINLRHVLSADYAVARIISLGASFQYLRTAEEGNFIVINDDGNPSDPEDDLNFLFNGDIAISAFFYSAYIKFFDYKHAGSIAPNGRFHKIEVAYFSLDYKTSHEGYKATDFYDPYFKIEDAGFTIPKPTVALFYTFGRQYIFSDKFIFTTGGQLGLSGKIFHVFKEVDESGRSGEENFQQTLNMRVAGAMAIGFQIGIGLLK